MIQVSSEECWRLERGNKQQLIYVEMVSTTQDADPYLQVSNTYVLPIHPPQRPRHNNNNFPFQILIVCTPIL